MAKLINTNSKALVLEKLISRARKQVVIISPLLALNKETTSLIQNAMRQGVHFYIVYAQHQLKTAEYHWLQHSSHITLLCCEDLTAKCYFNESYCIVSSLNLLEFSQASDYDMSFLLSKRDDNAAFCSAVKEAERLIRISEKKSAISAEEQVRDLISTSNLASKHQTETSKLLESLRATGFIATQDGSDQLTIKSKNIGAEFRHCNKGDHFYWPADINLNTMLSSR